MPNEEWVKFDPNCPVELAFTYANGIAKQGDYGQWFYRKTVDGRPVNLTPILEKKLSELGYKPKELVIIEKCQQGKEVRWDVHRPGENGERRTAEPERPLAGQPQRSNGAPKQAPTAGGMPLGTISSAMKLFLKEAVDLTKYAIEYANSQSFPMPADMLEVVQKIAVSLYIQYGKEGNIRRMHDFREMENTDAQFKQAGSQAAADAVALRKLAESRKEATEKESMPPPPAWSQEIDDSDVPF